MRRLVALAALACVGALSAFAINVALGKTVTGVGHFGELRPGSPWEPPGTLSPFSSLTDDGNLPEGSVWHHDTIWWDEGVSAAVGNYLEVDLGGVFTVSSVKVQADNNDNYLISVLDENDNWYSLGWFLPVAGFGMTTRDSGPLIPF